MTDDGSTPQSTPSNLAKRGNQGGTGGIAEHLPCGKCGYDMFALSAVGCCPECGAPVRQTLDLIGRLAADPSWLKTIKRGSGFTALGIGAIMICGLIDALPLQSPKPTAGSTVCCTVASLLLLGGLLMLTSPEPGRSEQRSYVQFRRRFRTGASLGLAFMPFVLLLKFAVMTPRAGCFAFLGFLVMCVIQWLVAVLMWTPAIKIARRFIAKRLARAFSALQYAVLTSMGINLFVLGWAIMDRHEGGMVAAISNEFVGYVLLTGGIVGIILLMMLRSILRSALRRATQQPIINTQPHPGPTE